METCKLCGTTAKSFRGLAVHLNRKHNGEITSQEYYDKFILIADSNKCKNPECNKTVRDFRGLGAGYYGEYCSRSCISSSEKVLEKKRQTNIKNHGNPNYRNIEKYVDTCMLKYNKPNALSKGTVPFLKRNATVKAMGVDNVLQLPEVREKINKTNAKSGRCIDADDSEKHKEYINYTKAVHILSKRNYKKLYNNWDGYDYYDGEYIKNNYNIFKYREDVEYPTVDHLKSVIYCFLNGISAKECADLNNLAITKKIHNIRKNYRTDEEYAIWLASQN
jgi:hypothetical protein